MKTSPLLRISAAVVLFVVIRTVTSQDLNGDGILNRADCQTFIDMLGSGTAASRSDLDVNEDGVTDLRDALLYGQWVNGLWNNPSGSYRTLYSSSPQDTVAYNNYQQNLSTRKNTWTIEDLKKNYPDNTTATPLNYDAATVVFAGEVDSFFSTPDYMKQVLENGIAVNTQKVYPNFYSAFDAIHTHDLPVIFTTDAMLQTIYRSYDNILMQLELDNFIPTLDTILRSSLRYLNNVYGAADYVQDVRTYFETGLKLLSPDRSDLSENPDITRLLSLINAEKMVNASLCGRDKVIDFSQFKPRGHYTKAPQLAGYFKAMMWLGRADLAFEIGGSTATDPSRMKKGALVVWDCVVNSGTLPEWIDFNTVIEYMVGTSDGFTVQGMGNLVHDLGDIDIPEFVGSFNEPKFDSAMLAGDYGTQMILSESKTADKVVDKLILSRIFNLFPQRFVIDSYTMSQLVYPFTERQMPSSLDIAFVLGDNTAIEDHPEISHQYVAGILGSQRQLFDEISPAGWQSNMYMSWLNMLRQLSGLEKNPNAAPVFRSRSWAKKMRNTQLTSWAHLRHNTILYAKQSYTAEITCSHPKAYVEPYPGFFRAVTSYAQKGQQLFASRSSQVAGYFNNLAAISIKLAEVAVLTSEGKEPTTAQVEWLRTIVSSLSVGGDGYNPAYKVYDGWYFDLVYENMALTGTDPSDAEWATYTTIADVHTKPLDETGPALVLHAATGYINLMTVAVEIDSCISLYVGPVGSYYDVTTSADSPRRLNDDEWEQALLDIDPQLVPLVRRPAWMAGISY